MVIMFIIIGLVAAALGILLWAIMRIATITDQREEELMRQEMLEDDDCGA